MPCQRFAFLLFAGLLIPVASVPAAPGIRQVLNPAEASKGDTLLWTVLPASSWQALGIAAGVPRIDLRLIGGDRLPNPAGEALNSTVSQLSSVLPPSFKTWAGESTPAFLQQINQELAMLFPGKTQRVSSPGNPPPHSLIAVTALNHRVEFPEPFYRARGSIMRFVTSMGGVRPVAFFGTQGVYNEDFALWNLQVHAYSSRENFVIELGTRTKGESVWIVRAPGQPSLLALFDRVKRTVAAPAPADPALTPLDVLQIPCLDFTSTADLTKELAGSFNGIAGNTEVPYRIAGCHQWIDFQLDENGARIKAAAEMSAEPFGGPPPRPRPKPRQFICDGPFTLMLWRKDSQLPYAAFHLDGGKWN